MAGSNQKSVRNSGPPHPRSASVSLKELAAHLELSQTTISRVVNGSPGVARIPESTQKRILEAASRLRYEPNVLARGLRRKRSSTIGVILPEISEGYSTMVLRGIEDALLKEGFFYLVVSHRYRLDLLEAYPKLLLSRAVEGIIAINTELTEDLPIPVAAVSGHRHHDGVVNVQLDHARAARLALEHLQALGHRRIAFIKGQAYSSDTLTRWRAICEEAHLLGLKIDPRLIVQLADPAPGTGPGYAATQQLLRQRRRFSAIFAFNDLSAIGAISALREAGLRVPHDVSVVGFDDISSAETNNPGLSTVRQPLEEMGGIAASTLLSMIRREEVSKHIIRVMPTFVVRQSTGQAP